MHELDNNYLINEEISHQSFETMFQRQGMQNIPNQPETGIAYLTNQTSKGSNTIFPMVQNISRNENDCLTTMVSVQQTMESINAIQPQLYSHYQTPVVYLQYLFPPTHAYFDINHTENGITNISNCNGRLVHFTNITPNFIPNALIYENTINNCDQSLEAGSYSIVPSPMETPTKISDFTQMVCNDIENKENIGPIENIKEKKNKKLKEFPCPIKGCQLIIKRKDDLARHLRTHSGEKPFICSVCKKGFSRKDHLRSHERTHTKERPYCCIICQRGFSRSDERKRHMKIHFKPKKSTKRLSHDKYIDKSSPDVLN